MTRTLQELSDRLDLSDLMTRYATCVDARELAGLDEVFTPDARVSFAAAGGPEGDYPTIRQWLSTTLPIFAATQHLMSNLEAHIDGDTARGRCMCFNPMAFDPHSAPEQRVMFYGLWYRLEFMRTEDGWVDDYCQCI